MNPRKAVAPVLFILLLIGVAVAISYSVREAKQTHLVAEQAAAHTVIKILTGSEKEHFLSDPELARVLDAHQMSIVFQKAGSREIATRPDLKTFDIAFPAGAHAAVKISQITGSKRVFPFVYTPIAVASWRSLLPVLEKSGLVSSKGGEYFIVDMTKLLAVMEKGERWRDLPDNDAYAVGKSVLVTSTDVRKSNSGALYLALAAYLANDNNVVNTEADVTKIAARMVTLFSRQGFQESSSAGPFEDYTTMGIGKAPLVMIYEQQFLEYLLSHPHPNPDMVLLYPQPTILSKHTMVALSDNGARFAQEMVSDPKIASIAQRYGFRTEDNTQLFAAIQAKKFAIPHTLVEVVDPPSYDILEKLIDAVDAGLRQ
jgi:hypothetical protein